MDNDVIQVVRDIAQERQQSLVVCCRISLDRDYSPQPGRVRAGGVIPILARKPGARAVTTRIVKDLLESEE